MSVDFGIGSKFTGAQTGRRRQIYPQELTFWTSPPYGEFVPPTDVALAERGRGLHARFG
jgi:hypothetical protein